MCRLSLLVSILLVLFGLARGSTTINVTENIKCGTTDECKDPSHGACGANAVCYVDNLTPRCLCLPGFVGHPFTGCDAGSKGGESCKSNSDCPEDKGCSYYQCVDPCLEECGESSDCKVINHYPVCACSQGYVWDSKRGCQPNSLSISSKYYNGIRVYKLSDLIYNIQSKKRFYASTYKATWMEAVSECSLRGMEFATITSQQDQNDAEVAIKSDSSGDSFYVSGMRLGKHGEYIWAPNGKPVSYTNWGSSEPTGGDFPCIHIPQTGDSPYQWETTTCTDKEHFLCEYYVI